MNRKLLGIASAAILLTVLLFGNARNSSETSVWRLAVGCSAASGVVIGVIASALLNASRARRVLGMRIVVAIVSAIVAALIGNYCGRHADRYVYFDDLEGVEGPFCAFIALMGGLTFGAGLGQRTRRD